MSAANRNKKPLFIYWAELVLKLLLVIGLVGSSAYYVWVHYTRSCQCEPTGDILAFRGACFILICSAVFAMGKEVAMTATHVVSTLIKSSGEAVGTAAKGFKSKSEG